MIPTSTLRAAAAAALFCALLAGAGCTTEERGGELSGDFEGHRMLVLPFKEKLYSRWKSSLGTVVGRRLTRAIEKSKDDPMVNESMEVVPFDKLEKFVGNIHKDPEDIRPEEMGRALNASLILSGEIVYYETRIKGDVGMARGKAKVRLRLFKPEEPDKLVRDEKDIEATFPRDDTFTVPTGDDPEEVDGKLMGELIDKMAKLFYRYEAQKGSRN